MFILNTLQYKHRKLYTIQSHVSYWRSHTWIQNTISYAQNNIKNDYDDDTSRVVGEAVDDDDEDVQLCNKDQEAPVNHKPITWWRQLVVVIPGVVMRWDWQESLVPQYSRRSLSGEGQEGGREGKTPQEGGFLDHACDHLFYSTKHCGRVSIIILWNRSNKKQATPPWNRDKHSKFTTNTNTTTRSRSVKVVNLLLTYCPTGVSRL